MMLTDKKELKLDEAQLVKVTGGDETSQRNVQLRPGCEDTSTPDQNYDDYESIVRPHVRMNGR